MTSVFRLVCTLMLSGAAMRAGASSLVTDAISPPPPPGFTAHTVDTGGANIHYVAGGKGPALLLIHGWPETWYSWRKMMPDLARSHTVIAIDLRGMGDSSLEPSGYDKKSLAEDVFRLSAKLGLTTVDLVGHDWGGPVAYAYAAQHRDAVRKLVLIEGAPFGPWMGKDVEPYWFFHLLRVPDGYAEGLVSGREARFLSYFYNSKDVHVVPAFGPDIVKIYTNAYARPGRMGPSYGLYRSIDQDVRDNTTFSQTPLTIPVLAIGAETGAGESIAGITRHTATNVTAMVFKGTGHFVPEERPAALTQTIEAFLAGQSVPAVWHP